MAGESRHLGDPDLSGSAGRVWSMSFDSRQMMPHSLGMWLIEAPDAHPVWDYHLTYTNFSDPEDRPKRVPEGIASHVFVMYALDKRFQHRYDPKNPHSFQGAVLQPIDMMVEFKAKDDADALNMTLSALEMCVNGELIPDSDFTRDWTKFFQSA